MRKIVVVMAFLSLAGITLTLGGCGWHHLTGWRGCRYVDDGSARNMNNQNMPVGGYVNAGMRY